MFLRKKQSNREQEANVQTSGNSDSNLGLKYPKPHILLMDTEPKVGQLLRERGFNISEGSFGSPYKVQSTTNAYPLLLNGSIPENFGEKEIVVVDLRIPDVLLEPEGVEIVDNDGVTMKVSTLTGVIDSRPINMLSIRASFDRIYEHKGAFIVFADEKIDFGSVIKGSPYNDFHYTRTPVNNWGFMSTLAYTSLLVKSDTGSEINVIATNETLTRILRRHTQKARFNCTFDVGSYLEKRWIPLAENKYGNPVAGAIGPEEEGEGWIFIFPHVADKHKFLAEFLTEFLPELCPELFPYMESTKWVERAEYEIPSISILKAQIVQVQEQAAKQVETLEERIQQERDSMGYLHTLITGTGDALVSTVERALQILGFQAVVNIDEEMKKNESTGPKREDLQIRDQSPLVLVEVKGVTGTSKESSALQVSKYIAPRMKALGRTDIRGLSIVNHQRNIPALDRVDNPFSNDIIESAQHHDFGLITAWSLHKLVRSYLNLGWKQEQIVPLFYQNGYIEPIPSHYEYLGFIEHIFDKASVVRLQIESAKLHLGDRIAFQLPVEFEEQVVDSLRVAEESVEVADIGALATFSTPFGKPLLKEGVRVFRIKPPLE
jgi:hypothetical protein